MESYVADMQKNFSRSIKELHFFDANCWIGKSNHQAPAYLDTAQAMSAEMDRCGIEKALVSHTLARFSHPLVGNEKLLQEIAEFDRLFGCFILFPSATRELGSLDEYLDTMLKNGIRAAKLFPKSHNYSLAEWSSADLLHKLEERRIPLFIWARETDWDTLYSICTTYPQLPVVLEQCDEEAYWNLRFVFALLEKCQNLYVETNKGHLYLGIDETVKRFGASRLIFSTHLPFDDPYVSLGLITDGDFSSQEKEAIAHKNLAKLIEGVKS